MAPFLTHPLKLTPAGTFATVDDSTDEYIGQTIRIIESTRYGERPMAPGYGVPNPVFGAIHTADVQAVLDQFGPADVNVEPIDVDYLNDQTGTTSVNWSRTDND